MTKFTKVDLMEGLEERGNGAFDAEKLAEHDVDNLALSKYLAHKLSPIVSDLGWYLKDGAGFGVVVDGDEVTIIGLAPSAEADQ